MFASIRYVDKSGNLQQIDCDDCPAFFKAFGFVSCVATEMDVKFW